MWLTSDLRYTDACPRDSAEFCDMILDSYECQRPEFSPNLKCAFKEPHSRLSYARVILD